MLNYYTFHAMHSTESQIVDRQIISTDKPKPPFKHSCVGC